MGLLPALCLLLIAGNTQTNLLARKVDLDVREEPTLEVIAKLLQSNGVPFEMRGNTPGTKLTTSALSTGSFSGQPLAYVLERLLDTTEPAIYFREFEGKVVLATDRYVSIDPRSFSKTDSPDYHEVIERMALQAKFKVEYDLSIRAALYDKVTAAELEELRNVPFHRSLRKLLRRLGGSFVRNGPDADYQYTICLAGTLDRAFVGQTTPVSESLKLVIGNGARGVVASDLSADKSGVVVLGDTSIGLYSAYDGAELARQSVSGGKALRVGSRAIAVHQEGAVTLFSPSLSSQLGTIQVQRDSQIDFGFVGNLLYVKDSDKSRLYSGNGSWSEVGGFDQEFPGEQVQFLPLPKSELIIAQGSAKWVVYRANSGARVTELTPIPGEFTGDGVAGAIWTNPKYVKGVATSVSIRWLGRGGGSISNLEWKPSSNEVFSGAAIAPDGSLHCFGVRSSRKPQLATYKILPGKSGGSPTLKEYTRTSEARRAALQSANVLAMSDSEDKLVKATLDAVSSQIVERVIPEELAPMPKSSRMLFRFNHDQLDWFDPSTGGRMFTPILLRPKWGDRIGRFDPSTKLWLAHDQGPSAYERLVGEKLAAREDGLESGNRPVEGRARTILLAHERTRLVSYVVDIEGSIGKSVGVCYPVRESPIRGEVVAFADNGSRVVVDISPKPKPGQKAPERLFQVLNTTSWKIDGPIFKESNIVGANGKYGMRIDVALSPDGQSIAFRSSEGGVLYAVDGSAAGTLIDGEAAKSSTGAFGFDRTGRYLLLSKPQGAPNGDETIIREVGGPLLVRLPAYRVIGDKTGESFAVLAGAGVAIYRPGKGFEPNSLQRVPFGESIVNAEFADSDRYLYLLTTSGMMQVWKTAPFGMAVNFVALTASNYVTFDNSYQYMASRGGAQAISFQRGRQQVSFDSYDLTLNRPDIILDALGAASKNVVSVYSKARKTRLAKYWEEVRGGGGQRDPSKDIAVPLVKLLLPNGVSESSERVLDVNLEVTDEQNDIARVDMYVNGVPIHGRNGITPEATTHVIRRESVRLSDGLNIIEVAATNRKGMRSATVQRRVRCTAAAESPDLYFVGIATPEYSTLRPLPGTTMDVENLAKFFKSGAGIVSGPEHVHALVYPNGLPARKELKSIETLLSGAKEGDIVIFLYSGHGANAESGLYFPMKAFDRLSSPVTPDDDDVPIIHISDIEGIMDSTRARQKLVMIDSCQSGETTAEAFASSDNTPLTAVIPSNPGDKGGAPGLINAGAIDVVEIMKSSFNDLRRGTGAITLAAASASQNAKEEKTGGVFAQAVLQGLKGEADTSPKDGKVTVNELYEFVTLQVVVQSNGKQRPTARSENIRNNFVLSKTR